MQRSRTELLTRTALVVMGVMTAFPVQAVFDPDQLTTYGVDDPDPIVLTLLQHRGVLQLVLGAALIWAALRPAVRVPVAVAVIGAKGAALALTASRPDVLAEASTVALVFDPICIVILGAMLVQTARQRRREPGAVRTPTTAEAIT